MENTATNQPKVTQLTAINTAKILTSLCSIGFAIAFGVQDLRQVIYLYLYLHIVRGILCSSIALSSDETNFVFSSTQ